MSRYEKVCAELRTSPRIWLITGVAGFIGSNLLEALLKLDQRVVGLDNFATGHRRNLDDVRSLVERSQWARFRFIEGDICSLDDCHRACAGVEYVLHEAALGSVPRSLVDPIPTHATNNTGFVNMLVAARDAKVRRFIYAASSSTYGDHPGLPKVEDVIGRPLSPYAVTKLANELYADVFARCYGLESIGLRYFNVFGARQDPNGAYAAVIPKWTAAMIKGEPVFINGDGKTSRDFCYIANAVQANLLASAAQNRKAINEMYNIAVGDRTTLNDLYAELRGLLARDFPHVEHAAPCYRDFRTGDVRHSQADIGKAVRRLGYAPTHGVAGGLKLAMTWYVQRFEADKKEEGEFVGTLAPSKAPRSDPSEKLNLKMADVPICGSTAKNCPALSSQRPLRDEGEFDRQLRRWSGRDSGFRRASTSSRGSSGRRARAFRAARIGCASGHNVCADVRGSEVLRSRAGFKSRQRHENRCATVRCIPRTYACPE